MATANESTVKTTKPQLLDASVLAGFKLKRVLNEDPRTRSAALLGTFAKRPLKKNEDEDVRVTEDAAAAGDRDQDEDEEQAVLLLEKTPFNQSFYASVGSTLDDPVNGNGSDGSKRRKLEGQEDISEGSTTAAMASTLSSSTSLVNFSRLESLGENDIYLWLLAHSRASEATSSATADMKLTLIRPATQAHIVKFSHQEKVMVYETPEMYWAKTLPWLEETQVGDRLKWVQNILQGKKEQENVLWRDSDPESGFVILPDLKWDRLNLSSLYLIGIASSPSLRSMRDLRPCPEHIHLLKKIRQAASQIATERYGLTMSSNATVTGDAGSTAKAEHLGKLRCYIHYVPSYYQLHVHILSSDFTSHPGAIVGQAHLLEDIIDLLELGVDFTKRTLGYAVSRESELFGVMSQ